METAYEAIYIVDPTLAEEQTTAIVEKYSGVVSRAGGTVDDIDRMETRRLAYDIKGRREGQYIVMNFRSEPDAKNELDRIYRISDDVLRFMIVKQDEKADRFPSKIRIAEQERREREYAARAAAAPPPPVQQPVTDLAASPATGSDEDAPAITAASLDADTDVTTTDTAVEETIAAPVADDATAADAAAVTTSEDEDATTQQTPA